MEISLDHISERRLGTDTLHIIALRACGLHELSADDIYSELVFDRLTSWQSVWLQKEEAERYVERILRPREVPPWHRREDYPRPHVIALSIADLKSFLEKASHRPEGIEIMDSPEW